MIKQALMANVLVSTCLPPRAFATDTSADGSLPGDDALTCDALMTERDKIETAEAKRAKRAQTGRKALSFAGHVLSVAGPSLGYSKGATTALVAKGVIGAVSAQNASEKPPEATEELTPAELRLARVKALITEKAC